LVLDANAVRLAAPPRTHCRLRVCCAARGDTAVNLGGALCTQMFDASVGTCAMKNSFRKFDFC